MNKDFNSTLNRWKSGDVNNKKDTATNLTASQSFNDKMRFWKTKIKGASSIATKDNLHVAPSKPMTTVPSTKSLTVPKVIPTTVPSTKQLTVPKVNPSTIPKVNPTTVSKANPLTVPKVEPLTVSKVNPLTVNSLPPVNPNKNLTTIKEEEEDIDELERQFAALIGA